MAVPKLFFSFLFLLLLSSFLHLHARDGQFSNKVTKKTEEEVVQVLPKTEQLPTFTTTGTTSSRYGETFTKTNSNNKEAHVTNSQGMSRGYNYPTGTSYVLYRGESGESNARNNYKNDASVTGSQGTEGDSKVDPCLYDPNDPSCNNNGAHITGRQSMSGLP